MRVFATDGGSIHQPQLPLRDGQGAIKDSRGENVLGMEQNRQSGQHGTAPKCSYKRNFSISPGRHWNRGAYAMA